MKNLALDYKGAGGLGGLGVANAGTNISITGTSSVPIINVVNNPTFSGDVTLQADLITANSNNLTSLTTVEVTQLLNIDTSTINATQWGYLGALDQGLTQASSVTFSQASLTTLVLSSSFTSLEGNGIENNAGTLQIDYNTTNLKITSNELNTIQDIALASSPTFAGLTVVNSIDEFSIDGTMVGNSDTALPSEKAIVTFVGNAVTTAILAAISGTVNFIPLFTGVNAIGNSVHFQTGTLLSIGSRLDVDGANITTSQNLIRASCGYDLDAATILKLMDLACDSEPDGAGVTVFGIDIDMSDSSLISNDPDLYGVRIRLPSTYGAGTNYALYMSGGGDIVTFCEGATAIHVSAGDVLFDDAFSIRAGTGFDGDFTHSNTANRSYTFQDMDYIIAGLGDITTAIASAISGTTGTIPVFTGTNAIGDSILTEVSGDIQVGGDFLPASAGSYSCGSASKVWGFMHAVWLYGQRVTFSQSSTGDILTVNQGSVGSGGNVIDLQVGGGTVWRVWRDGKMYSTTGTGINDLSIDGTLVGNSDDSLVTEKAIVTYVGTSISSAISSAISGTTGTIPIFTGVNAIGDSIITESGGIITVTGALTITSAFTTANSNNLGSLTTGEVTQLLNIGLETISAGQWGYLGALNQGLTTSSDVQFDKITIIPTGAGDVINITPTITLPASTAWGGFGINGNSLDPTGANCEISGIYITFTGVNMANNPKVWGLRIFMPATYGSAEEYAARLQGDGKAIEFCNDAYAIHVATGDVFFDGGVTYFATTSFYVDAFGLARFDYIQWMDGSGFYGAMRHSNSASRSYTFQDRDYTVAGLDDLTTAISGTTNYIPKFTGANAIGDSIISEGANLISIANAELDLTGVNASIDLNPSGTGASQKIISIIPTASILNETTWRGIYIVGDALGPEVGGGEASWMVGVDIVFTNVDQTYDPGVWGIQVRMPNAYTTGGISAGKFYGDGRSVQLCTDDFAISTSGDVRFSGITYFAGGSLYYVDLGGHAVFKIEADDVTYTGIVTNDSGELKYRTKAQVLSDIGAAPLSHTMASHSDTLFVETLIINDNVANQEIFMPTAASNWCYTSGTISESFIFNIARTTVLGTSTSNICRWSWDIPIPAGAKSITGFYAYQRGNGSPAGNHKIHIDDPDYSRSSTYTPAWNIKNSTTSYSGDNYIKRVTLWTGTWDLSAQHSGHNTVRIYWETTGTLSNNVHIAGLWVRFE